MKSNKITIEHFGFFLIFLFSLGYRLYGLERPLLTDGEASLALQALDLATGKNPAISSQALYVLFTGVLFFLFGSGEFLARLLPAFAGSLLVLAPLLYKPFLTSRVARAAALVMSLLLAVESGLLAASRTADSRIIAITALVLAFGFYLRGRNAAAGIFTGLAFLSGPYLWPGIIGLAGARIWNGRIQLNALPEPGFEPAVRPVNAAILRNLTAWAAGTLVFIGSLFFIVPAGLSGAVTSLLDYLSGWLQLTRVTPQLMVIALAVYQPLGVLLGLSVILWNWRRKDSLDAFLWKWWLVALLLAVANPGMVVLDLTWCLVPLGALSARQLVRLSQPESGEKWSLAGQTGITVLLLLFAIYSLVGITNPSLPNQPTEPAVRLAIFGGAVILLGLITLLVAWGWSLNVAKTGLAWGTCIILTGYVLAGSWNAAGLGRSPQSSLWRSEPYPLEGQLLTNTIHDYSRWRYGRPEVMEVTIQDIDSPALRWLLRGQRTVTNITYLPATAQPHLLITRELNQVNLGSSYSGQDFIWEYQPAWDKIAPADWMRWIHFRESPVIVQTVVLWVRSDLFPNSAKTSGILYE